VQIQKDQVIPNKIHIRYMLPFCTFMPSTTIAKLKVYAIRLHRLPIWMGSFVVRVSGEACLLAGLAGDAQWLPLPSLPTSVVTSKYVGAANNTYHIYL
jgi:hypothetical protein